MSDEIKSSTIRSSLAELELGTSKILKKFEDTDIKLAHQQIPKIVGLNNLNEEKLNDVDILTNLENIVFTADSEDCDFILPTLNDSSRISLMSHSIIKYLTYLESSQLAKVSKKISTDTQKWIANELFKFLECAVSYHKNITECFTRVVRLALIAKFPDYLENGISSLPKLSIYISENFPIHVIQHSCKMIGLSQKSIKVVKNSSSAECIDEKDLQSLITKDIEEKNCPILLISLMGSTFLGNSDNLLALREICEKQNIWLHLNGPTLAVLPIEKRSSESIQKFCDSCDLNIGSWFGIAGLPNILLYKQIPNFTSGMFESDPLEYKLSSLSVWLTLQNFGKNQILEKLIHAFDSCRILYEITSRQNGIRMLSKKTCITTSFLSNTTTKDLVIPVVVFQFDGSINETENQAQTATTDANDTESKDTKITDPIVQKTIEKITNSSYYDKLNSWLGQTLQRDFPQIQLEIVDHQLYGTCLRYCPFELNLEESVPTVEAFEQFAEFFENQVDILRATLKLKSKFIDLVEKSPELRLVGLSDWAGLGGVMYVPEGWENIMTDQAKTELNKLNADLVETLRNADNAFSLGEGDDGLICVRFGMVTFETEVAELLDLLSETGRSLQENSKLLDTFTDLVKKGIQQAELDIQRETEEKIWQEGILRHVPVVGSFVNWLSPVSSNETGIKGRSLNLQEGVVESTENIYKYHYMQKSGPTHSRNGSETSNQSSSNK